MITIFAESDEKPVSQIQASAVISYSKQSVSDEISKMILGDNVPSKSVKRCNKCAYYCNRDSFAQDLSCYSIISI